MRKLILTLIGLHVLVGTAHSQEFVAVRAGTNLVGNTFRVRETKPEPRGGGSIGAFLSPHWAVEFEHGSAPRILNVAVRGGVKRFPELQAQVGVGEQFGLYPRLQMAIDIRGNGGGSTMIVRPTAALIHYFR